MLKTEYIFWCRDFSDEQILAMLRTQCHVENQGAMLQMHCHVENQGAMLQIQCNVENQGTMLQIQCNERIRELCYKYNAM